jgi:hypothetical protein
MRWPHLALGGFLLSWLLVSESAGGVDASQAIRLPSVAEPASLVSVQPAGFASSLPRQGTEPANTILTPPVGIRIEPATVRLAQQSRPVRSGSMFASQEPWRWQLMPEGLIYRSYMAGMKEPRFAAQWVYEKDEGSFWDTTLGGRVAVVRYGTTDPLHPQGWEVDFEGAAFPRLDIGSGLDLTSADFRVGVPLTYGRGRYQMKLAFYHLSSHLGDEYMLKHPTATRINYSRDVFVCGHSFYPTDRLRLYGEAGWAFYTDGGTEPWEFQFGFDYSAPQPTGFWPVPFVAANAHLREEVDFGGNFVVQAGLLWRGATGHLWRMGMHYFTGKSEQFEFFNQHEDKIGLGMWFDY